MRKLIAVQVYGYIDEFQASLLKTGHNSVPVRFLAEDGSFEWLWVRKSRVRLVRASKASKTRKEKKG